MTSVCVCIIFIGVGTCVRLEGPKDNITRSARAIFWPHPHSLLTTPIFASTRLCEKWVKRFPGCRTSSKSSRAYYLAVYSWSFVSWLNQACEISVDRLYLGLSVKQSVRWLGGPWPPPGPPPGPPYSYAYDIIYFIDSVYMYMYIVCIVPWLALMSRTLCWCCVGHLALARDTSASYWWRNFPTSLD